MKDIDRLAARFDRAHMQQHAAVRARIGEAGLYRGQPPLLEYIEAHDGCTQKSLAEALGLSAASVAISTKRLEKAGLLEKSADETNLRCNCLRLTELGRQKALLGRAILTEVHASAFRGFSAEERAVFSGFLDRIIRNLGGVPGEIEILDNVAMANRLHAKRGRG